MGGTHPEELEDNQRVPGFYLDENAADDLGNFEW